MVYPQPQPHTWPGWEGMQGSSHPSTMLPPSSAPPLMDTWAFVPAQPRLPALAPTWLPNSALILQTLVVPSPRKFAALGQTLASLQSAARYQRQLTLPRHEAQLPGVTSWTQQFTSRSLFKAFCREMWNCLCIKWIAEAYFSKGQELWSTQKGLSLSQKVWG